MLRNIGILTHRDVDGVCSAALAKIVCPDADVEFAEPFELATKLLSLPTWRTAIVSDLGISAARSGEVKNAFREAAKSRAIIYIDHHSLPRGVTRRTLPCNVFVHKPKVSASELAMEFFKPPASSEYIALLGAIGDYQEHTRKMRELMAKYGKRIAYFEEFLLEQALEASRADHPFKRGVIKALAQGLWPSDIPGLMQRARAGIKQEKIIEDHVKKNLRKMDGKVAMALDVPFMATGKAAIYAMKLANVEVGIGAYQDGDYIRLSMRRGERSDLNLKMLIQGIALKIGGEGGGHEDAVGGRIPAQKFDTFIEELNRLVARFTI